MFVLYLVFLMINTGRTHIKVITEVTDKATLFEILNIRLGTSDGIKLLFKYENLFPDEILRDVRYQSLKAFCSVVYYKMSFTSDKGTLAMYRKLSSMVIQKFLWNIVTNKVKC